MAGRHREAGAGRLGLKCALAGAVMAGAAMAAAGAAAAEPPPPPPADPVAIPEPPPPAPLPPGAGLLAGPIDPAAITAAPPPVDPSVTLLGPLGAVPGGGGGQDLLLSQYQAPSVGGAPAAPPSTDVLQGSSFLIPNNYRVPAPDQDSQDSPYQLTPGVPGPFARVDGLKGLHAMVHGALGRMPADQLSEPLAGTAPPPGTALPVGPEQNLPEVLPPVDPGALPPPVPPAG